MNTRTVDVYLNPTDIKNRIGPILSISANVVTRLQVVDDDGDFVALDTGGNSWYMPKGCFTMIKLGPVTEV